MASAVQRTLARRWTEAWFGKRNLLNDAELLRALARGNGWVRIEALCTQPKMLLLQAQPRHIADALEGSRVVETSRRKCAERRHGGAVEWHVRPRGIALERLLHYAEEAHPGRWAELEACAAEEGVTLPSPEPGRALPLDVP